MRAASLALSLVLLGACGGGSAGEVTAVPGRAFDPVDITVAVGETVTWTIDSDDAHTVTAYDGSVPGSADYFASGNFASEDAAREDLAEGLLKRGDTFEFTFDEPGTYEYFCIPHEDDGMKGTVTVTG
jgi:plastocyanin